MRSLILVLLVVVAGATACSKKNNSVATPPAPVTPVPPAPVDPVAVNYGLSDDNIITTKTGAGYMDMNYTNDSIEGYFDLIHSALGYMTYKSSKYGASNSYPFGTYADGVTCDSDYLDDLFDSQGFAFDTCADYFDGIEELSEGEIYLEAKLVTDNIVEGNIHATLLYPPPYYHVTKVLVPYRGIVEKKDIGAGKWFYEIKIGSSLLIYTADNKTPKDLRSLTMDFGMKEIGQVNLTLQ